MDQSKKNTMNEYKKRRYIMSEWKVTYEGGFYPKRGCEGKAVRVDKEFR